MMRGHSDRTHGARSAIDDEVIDIPRGRHPSSDGAHRLAWWLADRDEAGFGQIAAGARVSFDLIDRLLAGDIEPADDVAAAIGRETEGAVLPDDWLRGGSRGWLDRPAPRPDRRGAA